MRLAVTPQEDLTVAISGLSFLMALMVLMFGAIIRITRKWTRIEIDLSHVADDLKEIVRNQDDTHKEILAQMREDRRASNERLQWLERNVYPRLIGSPADPGRFPNV